MREKAAFKQQYGQELQVPKTWDDLAKVASSLLEKRAKLAGKTLNQDFYGFAFLGARDLLMLGGLIFSVQWGVPILTAT